jgi:bifunctional UDP-N-acetylglucosamine pyrophosphorylase/glucosamine-1-phosphate N-acetyltransferase
MPVDIVILAAGQGTRMNSSLPKVLHRIAGKSLLQHVVDAASAFGDVEIHIVIGHGAQQVRESIQGEHLHWVMQEHQLGTGHALLQALPNLREDAVVLILYGDVPLVNASTLKQLVIQVDENNMALLTVELDNPSGYGRVLRDADNSVCAIVEHKDASEAQRLVREVNTGIMAVHQRRLAGWLKELTNHNAQKEYYLTDIIGFASRDGVTVNAIVSESTAEVLGVNDRYQQAQLERIYQQRTARQLMAQGVTLMDPARFDCRGHLTAGRDVTIDVNVVFEGQITLGHHVHIEPNCVIRNARIGNHVTVKANSVIEEAVIADNCEIGPFARLRPGTQLKSGARIGNFVETKKAVIGRDSKVNHLSYIGDAEIGNDSNIGAGTITCNYDGVNKHKTTIGDHVFIGSNTALVAPVMVENGATVGAGSVVTSDVKENQLAVARGKQRNIDGWKRPAKNHETR